MVFQHINGTHDAFHSSQSAVQFTSDPLQAPANQSSLFVCLCSLHPRRKEGNTWHVSSPAPAYLLCTLIREKGSWWRWYVGRVCIFGRVGSQKRCLKWFWSLVLSLLWTVSCELPRPAMTRYDTACFVCVCVCVIYFCFVPLSLFLSFMLMKSKSHSWGSAERNGLLLFAWLCGTNQNRPWLCVWLWLLHRRSRGLKLVLLLKGLMGFNLWRLSKGEERQKKNWNKEQSWKKKNKMYFLPCLWIAEESGIYSSPTF